MNDTIEITVKSKRRSEFIDITTLIENAIKEREIREGVVFLFVPHTTAGITINENADPSVRKDIEMSLEKLAPQNARYFHLEGNADSHIKASIVGHSQVIFVRDGSLLLGRWQGVFFCEFDGPRTRKVILRILEV